MSSFDAEQSDNPITLFEGWFDLASASELNDPNAMSLATCTPDGLPSVRMVLLKKLDDQGFKFFTNVESRKGRELLANPHAALCFHWKSLRRQVRVEGSVSELLAEDSDVYFHSRSRKSQLGAVASQQSRPLGSRAELETAVRSIDEQYPDVVPRPAYWLGFVVAPLKIEFWQDGPNRLHDRMAFTRNGEAWDKTRLYP